MTGHDRHDDRGEPSLVLQIRLKGWLDAPGTTWFGGLAVTLTADGDTLLTGPVADQAALHGLLKKVRDQGLTLLAINPVEPTQQDAPRRNP
jgi:hypothetical protein